MQFRFTLSHDILGSLEISPPDGWNDAKLKLERDPNFHSLIEYFDGSFIFYGDNGEINGGIDFIREVESTYGFDADVSILIELTFDGYEYFTVFSGLLKLEAIQEMEDNKMQIPIMRNDFWSKFINRKDTEVNLQSTTDLDGNSIQSFDQINLSLRSQKVRANTDIVLDENKTSLVFSGANIYLMLDWDKENLSEILTKYNYFIAVFGATVPFELYQIELAGDYDLDIQIHSYIDILGVPSSAGTVIEYYVKINDNTEEPFLTVDVTYGAYTISKSVYTGTKTLNKGDFIYVYGRSKTGNIGNPMTLVGENGMGTGGEAFTGIPESPTYFRLVADTIFDNSNCESFLLHDAAGAISDRIIGQQNSLYSEFVGSSQTIYRQYDSDGCGWKYAITKGLQIRRYSLIEKPFFLSFMKWWDGANPILNLGLGYEEIEGSEVIRIEEKEHFYDDSDVSLNISNVRQISRAYDPNVIFKTIRIGYKQWQSENISGIDDPQTKQTRASRLQKAGTDVTLESEFIAASMAIETTRRKTREKSADYKFDNETFIIAINPIPVDVSPETSPDVNDYAPELDENFTSITNLFNAETRYNSRITPARNFIRWIKWLSGCLQKYPGSMFKFTGGEGNYAMISDMSNTSDGCDEYKLPLAENQDIAVYDEFFHLPFLFEIVVPMEWEDYQTIRDNRKKAIGISQTSDNHIKFFIKELEYEVTKSQATIRAWPTEDFEIQVIDTVPAMIQCVPENALTADNTLITADTTLFTADQTEYTI